MLLSVVMITKNADRLLDLVLSQAAKIANEIIIMDSGSTDKTLEIAKKYTQKIIQQEWLGFGPQKQKAIEAAVGRWILVLDADEVLDEKLLGSIREIIGSEKHPDNLGVYDAYDAYDAYELKRPLVFGGKILRRSVPLWTPRLFKKEKGKFTNAVVHEKLLIEGGRIGKIQKGELLHYSYASIGDWLLRMHRYTDLFVEEKLAKKSELKSVGFAVISAITVFIKIYFMKGGFLEGRMGFVVALNWAVGNYIKYVKLALRDDFQVKPVK